MRAALPLPGVLQVDARSVWRSEYWDISPVTRTDLGTRDEFHYKSTSTRLTLKHIPHYRVEIGAGFEYTNRDATGDLPELALDNRNSGKMLAETSIRIADGRYRNRLHAEGFLARESILGDFDYSGGTVELNNRFQISEFRETNLDWTITAGTSRGALPVEDYFVLGLDSQAKHLLRGHIASEDGRYGNAPMGTDFLLANVDLERRVTAIPLFNTFNVPFIVVKWEAFVDAGKTFDRARLFKQDKIHVDAGGGLKFETPTNSLNLIYGRALRDGDNVLYGYVEHRW
jgi:hypothetical protein